jgi:hypothetical protein
MDSLCPYYLKRSDVALPIRAAEPHGAKETASNLGALLQPPVQFGALLASPPNVWPYLLLTPNERAPPKLAQSALPQAVFAHIRFKLFRVELNGCPVACQRNSVVSRRRRGSVIGIA